MAATDLTNRDVTIPAAVAKRPLLVAVVALTGLLLGIWFSGRGGVVYQATATIVVEDPRTTDTNAIVLSPERYVAEQVAVFDLDTIASSAAEIATAEHQEALRSRSTAEMAIGGEDPVGVGIDGAVSLGDDGSGVLTKSADGAVSTSVSGTPVVTQDGTVEKDDGTPVLDGAGQEVFVGVSDVAIARPDGLIVIARTDLAPIVVSPDGTAIESFLPGSDLPDGVSGNEEGGVTVDAGSISIEVASGKRPIVRDAEGVSLDISGRIAPLGVNERFILLGSDGQLAATSPSDTVVVVDEEVVVVDNTGSVTQQTEGAQIESIDQAAATPFTRFDSSMIENNRTVRALPDSSVIEVTYRAPTEELAQIGANAVITAYTERLNSDTSSNTLSALDEADAAIAAALADLAAVEEELTIALDEDVDRNQLVNQYASIVRELARSGEDLIEGGPNSEAAAERVRTLLVQLEAVERIRTVELQQDEIAEIVARRDQAQERVAAAQAQRDEVAISESRASDNVVLASPATESELVSGLGSARLGFVGLIVGSILGAAIAYLLELRKPRLVESADDVMLELGLPLLGEVPDFHHERLKTKLPVIEAPRSFAAEAMNIAASTLAVGMSGDRGAIIGVISGNVGDGKTTIAANLAAAFARQQRHVLAIDADLEGQVLSLLYGYGPHPEDAGLWELLSGEVGDPEDVVKHIAVSTTDSFDLLLAGHKAERLRSRFDSVEISDLFTDLRDDYGVVVVDVPPVLNVAYATPLMRLLDGIVIVARPGTPARSLIEVHERLDFVGVEALGFIYNRGPLRPERTASISAQNYEDRRGLLRRRGRRPDQNLPAPLASTIEDA